MDKICSDSQPRQFWADGYYFLLMETKIVSESFDFRSAPMRVLALEDFSLQVSTKVSRLTGRLSLCGLTLHLLNLVSIVFILMFMQASASKKLLFQTFSFLWKCQ
jgi:hypothetical protein